MIDVLRNRSVIVTGASAGIGRATAIAFARRGARVVVAARRRERLDDLVATLEAEGHHALAVQTDVTDERAVAELVDITERRFGGVDVLVNNAGMPGGGEADTLTPARWRAVIETNLTSAFLCARAVLPGMKRQGRGRIINVGSISARVPRAASVAYATSKWGLAGLTHALALDVRDYDIAVSIFQPGAVASELTPEASRLSHEAVISTEIAADMIVRMADLPDHLNAYEIVLFPNSTLLLGRG